MACVLTIAVVANGEVVVGHVGDTRLYKLRARPHREAHARSFAGRASAKMPESCPSATRCSIPRRNEVYRDVGSERSRAGRSAVHRHPPRAVRAGCGAAAVQRRPDRLRSPSAAIRRSCGDYAGHPYEIVRALIDRRERRRRQGQRHRRLCGGAAVHTGGGHARSAGASRRIGVAAARVAAQRPPIAPAAICRRRRQAGRAAGSVWALVVMLLAASGGALYLQRDRLSSDISAWMRLARRTAGPTTDGADYREAGTIHWRRARAAPRWARKSSSSPANTASSCV